MIILQRFLATSSPHLWGISVGSDQADIAYDVLTQAVGVVSGSIFRNTIPLIYFKWTYYIYMYIYSYQRKLGSNLPSYGQIELWDSTSHNNTLHEGWCETVHHITIHHKTIIGYDIGWWGREVVTKGSGDEEGVRWLWEVVTKGSGDEGKWWRREVVRKGSGDEKKWWWREWWIWEGATKGSVDLGRKWGGSRSTKPCVFPCKVVAAGGERYLVFAAGAAAVVLVPPLCSEQFPTPLHVVLLCFAIQYLEIAL